MKMKKWKRLQVRRMMMWQLWKMYLWMTIFLRFWWMNRSWLVLEREHIRLVLLCTHEVCEDFHLPLVMQMVNDIIQKYLKQGNGRLMFVYLEISEMLIWFVCNCSGIWKENSATPEQDYLDMFAELEPDPMEGKFLPWNLKLRGARNPKGWQGWHEDITSFKENILCM